MEECGAHLSQESGLPDAGRPRDEDRASAQASGFEVPREQKREVVRSSDEAPAECRSSDHERTNCVPKMMLPTTKNGPGRSTRAIALSSVG